MRESASEACELRVDRLNVRDVFAPPSRECVRPSNVGDDVKENDEADMFGLASRFLNGVAGSSRFVNF